MYKCIKTLKKTNMKLLLFIIFCLFSQPFFGKDGNTVQPLSFEDALEKSLLQNELLHQSRLHKEEQKHKLNSARTLRIPQVSLSANYLMLSDDIAIDMSDIKHTITPLYTVLSEYGNFSGVANPDPNTSGIMPILPDDISTAAIRSELSKGLSQLEVSDWNKVLQEKNFGLISTNIVWPLFTGGKINAANRAAQIELKEASIKERQAIGTIYNQLAERYFGLVLASQAKEVRTEVFNSMELHLFEAEKLYEEGIISKAELLHSQLHFAQAERELKKSEREFDIIHESLRSTLSEDEKTNFLAITPLFYTSDIESIDFFKQGAKANNPILKEISSKQELAREGVKAERSDFFPTVAAFGNYNIASHQLTHTAPDYMAGITFSWKLIGGGSTYNKTKSAKLVESQALQAHSRVSRDIETGIEKYYQELFMALEQLEELKKAETFADEYYRIRHQAFVEGMATSTEVVDASLAISKVKIDQLQAAYQFDIALIKLLELAGMPEEFNHYKNEKNTIQLIQN